LVFSFVFSEKNNFLDIEKTLFMMYLYRTILVSAVALFLCLLVTVQPALGQVSIQLGSGTSVTSSTESSPVNIYYRSLHAQVVYTASEIAAAGGVPGRISQLGFYVETSPLYAMPDYTIKVKHTTAIDASTYDPGPLYTIYEEPLYAPVAGGFDMLVMDSLFVWNGIGNVLIDICFNLVNPTYDASGTVRFYNSPNGFISDVSDVSAMCSIPVTSVSNVSFG
jgi:hypothetical protein